jgi:hypothetical protein
MFVAPNVARARRAARVADAVRARLGENAITRARLLPRGPAKRRGGAGKGGKGEGDADEASSLPSVD